jgi:hypothetical protein
MKTHRQPLLIGFLIFAMQGAIGSHALGQALTLVQRAPDPHGSPRPARDAMNVPLGTSIYFELQMPNDAVANEPAANSIAVSLQEDHADAVVLLQQGGKFANGASGWARPSGKSEMVYIEPGTKLKPQTRYAVRVAAGIDKRTDVGFWNFTTESAPAVHPTSYQLDLNTPPVQWHGQFFSGICDVIFCTRAGQYGPTMDLMDQARKEHPKAWSLQRGFWLTGFEDRPPSGFFPSNLPNIVRERETRRISAMTQTKDAIVLHVEDFFGHEQYGIPGGRPVADDYHGGEQVLIADGVHDARAKVIATDSAVGTVTVSPFATPQDGWKIAYEGKLAAREDPDAPGLFPPGGCYLRKFDPTGTACYYWGRLDKEWDLAHRAGRRVVVNFADAPGDLSRDGRSWTTVKDYAQLHEVARTIAGHIIDRYGKDAASFTWSIFNEPDLGGLFWRASWDELQTYYDYATDGILRAFEDRGYDSNKVLIGGLEEGAIFGTNFYKLREFLAHCSPKAQMAGALPRNAAVADHRLDGKRSRRAEELCRAHDGKGSPCDFISIHSYNRSEMMAAKLIRAKEIALEIDSDFYQRLWIDSHESCPDWMPPRDQAAGDSYLGDGYFPSWCADVAHRQLLRAAADPRFAYGETILTVWPPPDGFATLNAVTRVIHYRDDDSKTERTATIPMPIFHMLNLLSDLGDHYWPLPEQTLGGHVIGGFASRDDNGVVRLLLFTHDAQDTQSRSDASFNIALDIASPGWSGAASMREYRIDRDHNSPYRLIQKLLGNPRSTAIGSGLPVYSKAQLQEIQKACQCNPAISTHPPDADGHLRFNVQLQGNGCDFVILKPKT